MVVRRCVSGLDDDILISLLGCGAEGQRFSICGPLNSSVSHFSYISAKTWKCMDLEFVIAMVTLLLGV